MAWAPLRLLPGRGWNPVVWLGVVAVLAAITAGVMMTGAAKAAPADGPTELDCVACHSVRLEAHSKLGDGNQACRTCHSSTDMTLLRLAERCFSAAVRFAASLRAVSSVPLRCLGFGDPRIPRIRRRQTKWRRRWRDDLRRLPQSARAAYRV